MSKYDMEFKKSIVALYQNGKSQAKLSREYGISLSAIAKWIKQFSAVKILFFLLRLPYSRLPQTETRCCTYSSF